MAGLEIDRKQLMVVIMVLAAGAVVAFWMLWRAPQAERITELETSLDSIQRQVGIARRDLAQGTVEDIRQSIEEYHASLSLMRLLVPSGDEIPTLLDDIRARAGRRDVRVAQFDPAAVQPGVPFDVHRYRFTVFGRYDNVGDFLSDVAALQRIMVPTELTLDTATTVAKQLYADTSGALLEASFQIRTYVKRPGAAGADLDAP